MTNQKQVKSLGIIDLAMYFSAAWHVGVNKHPDFVIESTLGKVIKIQQEYGYDRVICAIDAPPYKRSAEYPEYKAGRAPRPPEFYELYRDLQEECRKLGCLVWSDLGYEADDIIATVVRMARGGDIAVDIWSNDKDQLQLVDEERRVFVVRWGKDGIKRHNAANVKDMLGVWPSEVVDYLALLGDKADNLPGCPGLGAKTIPGILEHNTLPEVLEHLVAGRCPSGMTEKQGENFTRHATDILRSRKLIQLMTDADLPWEELFKEEEEESMSGIASPIYEPSPKDEEEYEREHSEPEPPFDPTTREDDSEMGALVTTPEPEAAPEPVPRKPEAIEKHEPPEYQVVHPKDRLIDSIELRPGVVMTPEKLKLMKGMAKAFEASGLYTRKFRQGAPAIFSIMELGVELGISPQVACQNFHIVEGKPSPAAWFLIGLARQHKDCEYMECIETTDKTCTWVTKKRNFPKQLTFTYTIEQAERAGLVKSGQNWDRIPDDMLRKTAGSKAARMWYPEACFGLHSNEELGFDLERES